MSVLKGKQEFQVNEGMMLTHLCCDSYRDLLRQALAVFDARPIWYRNERARTMFKLGCVLQDSGNTEEGQLLVKQAEELRREILRATVPPGDEKEFDTLVMFWSR